MSRITIALAATLAATAAAPATAADNQGFLLSGPGVEIKIVPDGQGFRGSFRFGEGADAIVGQGHFGPSGTFSWSPGGKADKPTDCPAGQVLRDGICKPQSE
jgi:hypothetical protein